MDEVVQMSTMELVVQISTIVSGLAAAVAIFVSIGLYIHGLNRERKTDTLKSFSEIRKNYFNSKTLDDKQKLQYLNELEYFSTGVNANVYDIEIVRRMSGSRLIKQYDTWAKDFVANRRERFGNGNAYCEYEMLIAKLRKK